MKHTQVITRGGKGRKTGEKCKGGNTKESVELDARGVNIRNSHIGNAWQLRNTYTVHDIMEFVCSELFTVNVAITQASVLSRKQFKKKKMDE